MPKRLSDLEKASLVAQMAIYVIAAGIRLGNKKTFANDKDTLWEDAVTASKPVVERIEPLTRE